MNSITLFNNASGKNLVEQKCSEAEISVELLKRLIQAFQETQRNPRRTQLNAKITEIIEGQE